MKGIRVTVEDLEKGTTESIVVPMNEYWLITTGTCFLAHVNAYPKSGTCVLTIKGRTEQPAAAKRKT